MKNCHCLCAANHPRAAGICTGTGELALKFYVPGTGARAAKEPESIAVAMCKPCEQATRRAAAFKNRKQGRSGGRPATQRELVEAWLKKRLKDGPVKAGTIYANGHAKGFSTHTMRRAAKKIGVTQTSGRNSMWSL